MPSGEFYRRRTFVQPGLLAGTTTCTSAGLYPLCTDWVNYLTSQVIFIPCLSFVLSRFMKGCKQVLFVTINLLQWNLYTLSPAPTTTTNLYKGTKL